MLRKLPGVAAPRLVLPAALLFLAVILLGLPLPSHAAPPDATAQTPRIQAMYTTWDQYYFYAAFRVRDADVTGTNATPTSQPQQDDDVEVFFETDAVRARIRTAQTFQMAVSAAQGAYYSVGDGSRIPKGRAIYSYKYAVTVDGTLNKSGDTDAGFNVELAIPWQEMGQSGPPTPDTTWGFNVISRDRSGGAEAAPATGFYSLSPKVHRREDVQNPSRWSRITFVTDAAGAASAPDKVVCAKVVGQYPRITGTIVSGDWPASTRLAFGTEAIKADAPTLAEEPNTTESPFDNPALAGLKPSEKQAAVPTGVIDMPNGASIKVIPGGIKNPVGMEVPLPPPPPVRPNHKGRIDVQVASGTLPPGVTVDSASFSLGQPRPPAFIMGIYRLDYNGDARKAPGQGVWNAQGGTALADQPMNGAGPWFSCLRPAWHRQQLVEMRRAGIEVALLRTRPDDPLLGRELDALVSALKTIKAAGQDYPLVGVDASTGQPDLDRVFAHIPAEFRAMQDVPGAGVPGVLVYDLSLGTGGAKALADGTPIARSFYNSGVASVSPGRVDKNGVLSRLGGRAYDTSWQVARVSTPDQIVVDSWNDFGHGTEIAPSRQYGEQYADATGAEVIEFDGSRQWHAKYLANATPRTVYPKTLYQIPVRVENAGTLPWRAGEGYSLSTRWYKDGKLYDDSAPRIPVAHDVLPGHTLTLSVGLVARDNFGEDLEPGDYTLVFDMVQSQDRWFSYAGDTPLQVPVTVVGANAAIGGTLATFLGTGTPAAVVAGGPAAATVEARNDGAAAWPTGYALGYKVQALDADGATLRTVAEGHAPLGDAPIVPGQIAAVSLPVATRDALGKALAPGAYRVHWFIRPDATGSPVNGTYDEMLLVAAALPRVSFVIVDLPRSTGTDKEETAHLVVENQGAETLKARETHIGYHWYYLDGTEREWDGGPTAQLTKDLAPGETDGAVVTTFRTPKAPGRYALVWDARVGDGPWQSTLPASVGEEQLQVLVSVGGKGSVAPVDLTKSFNALGIADAVVSKKGGFDGLGAALPAEMMPPDATQEVEGNPLLLGKPGPPLYPSGYYTARVGADADSNHAISFLYPNVRAGLPNVVSCKGQTLVLPPGKYRTLHLLAAAGGDAPTAADFGLQYDRETLPQAVTIATWGGLPPAGATSAFTAPYRQTVAGAKPGPVTLGDYTLPLDTGKKLTGLTLPNVPAVKIVAISLEKG
jgi:hypothetical protein